MKPSVGAALIAVDTFARGLGGGGGAPRPRPRPAAAAGPAGGAGGGGAGGGAVNAVNASNRGARSASVVHRDSEIVSAFAVVALVVVARRLNAFSAPS